MKYIFSNMANVMYNRGVAKSDSWTNISKMDYRTNSNTQTVREEMKVGSKPPTLHQPQNLGHLRVEQPLGGQRKYIHLASFGVLR